MRAIQYRAYGGIERLEIAEVQEPAPRPGEVIVRVRQAALNPKDALIRKGRFRLLSGWRFPKRPGLDFAGEVIASRSRWFRQGERVFGALHEWRFARGSLAEQVRAQEEEIAALPASFEEGAAIALAGLTSLQALRDVARVGEGTRLLINGGSGGVGTAAIQIAKILGAHVTTISSARNRELCRSLGADQTLEYGVPAQRFDCLFDVYGNGLKAEAAMVVSTVPTLGRLVLNALRTSKRLVIVRPRRKDLELLGQWMASGRLRAVIDSRHSLEHVRDAFRVLESRRARGKILIEP